MATGQAGNVLEQRYARKNRLGMQRVRVDHGEFLTGQLSVLVEVLDGGAHGLREAHAPLNAGAAVAAGLYQLAGDFAAIVPAKHESH